MVDFILDKKLYSAIDIVICISTDTSLKPSSSKSLSDKTGLGLRYVEQILQALVKGNVLKAMRGKSGGYLIAKDRRKLSLHDLYTSIQAIKNEKKNPIFSDECSETIADIDTAIAKVIEKHLKTITIEDINQDTLEKLKRKQVKSKSDFVI